MIIKGHQRTVKPMQCKNSEEELVKLVPQSDDDSVASVSNPGRLAWNSPPRCTSSLRAARLGWGNLGKMHCGNQEVAVNSLH